MMNYDNIDALLQASLGVAFPAAQLVIWQGGECVHDRAFGWRDPDSRAQPITALTRFDLASVSKLFTVAAFMRLADAGKVALDQTVSSVLPAFSGLRPIQPQPDPAGSGNFIEIVPPTRDTVDASRSNLSAIAHAHIGAAGVAAAVEGGAGHAARWCAGGCDSAAIA